MKGLLTIRRHLGPNNLNSFDDTISKRKDFDMKQIMFASCYLTSSGFSR